MKSTGLKRVGKKSTRTPDQRELDLVLKKRDFLPEKKS